MTVGELISVAFLGLPPEQSASVLSFDRYGTPVRNRHCKTCRFCA